ncbi:MAG: efflux transporter periplasmic adaptor subunit, partial [Muribaculaceae bacterium]|nr:efflux transporter periplasmic adaptor subunit [Muribaculaceae bacterium]
MNKYSRTAQRIGSIFKSVSKKVWIAVGVAIISVIVALIIFLRPKTPEPVLPTVEVTMVDTSRVNIYGDYVGRIRAQQFVEVHARVEGYLEKMMFKEGSYVDKGQTLFV